MPYPYLQILTLMFLVLAPVPAPILVSGPRPGLGAT